MVRNAPVQVHNIIIASSIVLGAARPADNGYNNNVNDNNYNYNYNSDNNNTMPITQTQKSITICPL